jgi:hypothetical protein
MPRLGTAFSVKSLLIYIVISFKIETDEKKLSAILHAIVLL